MLKNINKKLSALKWKEYHTEPKSFGKFGYWETEYNGIRIDLAPVQGLVHFMGDAIRQTVAGIELMAFSREQIEILLANPAEMKDERLGLDALEDDPIPVECVAQNQSNNLNPNSQNLTEIKSREELEPMPEGEVRVMTRQFLDVDGIEIEICINKNGKYFVRHNVYWWINHGKKNPDPERDCLILNLQSEVNRLRTIKWSGYKFRLETIVFSEDDVEVESILLPLGMFEDLLKDISRFTGMTDQRREEIKNGEYKPMPHDHVNIKFCAWLQRNSLGSLLQATNS